MATRLVHDSNESVAMWPEFLGLILSMLVLGHWLCCHWNKIANNELMLKSQSCSGEVFW